MSTPKSKSEISGVLGERVSIRQVNGSVVIKNRPARTQKSTEAQEQVKDTFMEATHWAKGQLTKPDTAKLYGRPSQVRTLVT